MAWKVLRSFYTEWEALDYIESRSLDAIIDHNLDTGMFDVVEMGRVRGRTARRHDELGGLGATIRIPRAGSGLVPGGYRVVYRVARYTDGGWYVVAEDHRGEVSDAYDFDTKEDALSFARGVAAEEHAAGVRATVDLAENHMNGLGGLAGPIRGFRGLADPRVGRTVVMVRPGTPWLVSVRGGPRYFIDDFESPWLHTAKFYDRDEALQYATTLAREERELGVEEPFDQEVVVILGDRELGVEEEAAYRDRPEVEVP